MTFEGNVIEREWVVEQMHDEKMRVIGKVIPNEKTPSLNVNDLEDIWDAANWGCHGNARERVDGGVYDGYIGHKRGFVTYVDLGVTDHCNDDIFIRKHYDTDNGFFIRSSRKQGKDEWVYGTKSDFLLNYIGRFVH